MIWTPVLLWNAAPNITDSSTGLFYIVIWLNKYVSLEVYLSFIFFVIINSFILLSWVYVLSHKEFIFKLLTLLQIKIDTFFFGKISAYDEIN